jgi:iron complex outermembrane receptor protein
MFETFFNEAERDRYSFYSEWAGDISDDLALELGARYVHSRLDSGEVSPNGMRTSNEDGAAFNAADRFRNFNDVDLAAVLRYSVSSELDVEIGLARKNRVPTYQELYLWTGSKAVGGFADGSVYLGDLELDHETAYQFEFGLDWHNDDAYIAPRFFYHYVDDYIQGVATDEAVAKGADLQWSNIAAQLYGVDLEMGYTFTDNLRFDAGLNYVRGERVNAPTSDSDLYRIAPLNGRTQLTFEKADWMAAVEGVFYADQGDVAGYNEEQKTKGYMLMNLRGKYEPFSSGVVIGLGIENVLDSKHYDHLGGYQNHNREKGRVAMQGRNIYATLSYNW